MIISTYCVQIGAALMCVACIWLIGVGIWKAIYKMIPIQLALLTCNIGLIIFEAWVRQAWWDLTNGR